MSVLHKSWIQSSVQRDCTLGAAEAARRIPVAAYVQGALHPQSELSSINFMHTAYMFYIPNFSRFLVDAEVFSPFFSYIFITIYTKYIGCLILGFQTCCV